MIERKYGWKPQPHDVRDFQYYLGKSVAVLPDKVDLTANMPPIWDQGYLGSCTAHGIGRSFAYAEKKAGLPVMMPSRLFLYYNERVIENTVQEDAGAIIRDGIKACNIYGVADETLWPYDIKKFKEKPTDQAYGNAKTDRIRYYASINNRDINNIKLCLFHGYPIVFGIKVYTAFESYKDGILDLPNGQQYLGGHCMCISGYDDSIRAVLVDNSWNTSWGIGGRCWISYAYLTSWLCSDFWMMRLK